MTLPPTLTAGIHDFLGAAATATNLLGATAPPTLVVKGTVNKAWLLLPPVKNVDPSPFTNAAEVEAISFPLSIYLKIDRDIVLDGTLLSRVFLNAELALLNVWLPFSGNLKESSVRSHVRHVKSGDQSRIDPDSEVISIHEHSDGSVLFRFGDPSEIAENVKLAEPKILEEIKKESQEGFSMVNVLDGDINREVIVKKLDKEDKFARPTEVANKGNESVSIVETESKSWEKLSEDSKRVELAMNEANPIGISNESISGVEKENESGEKLSEDSKRFELASNEANPIGIGNETISVVEKENESTEKFSEDSKNVELRVSRTDIKDSSPRSEDTKDNSDNSSGTAESAEEKIGGEMMLQSIHLKLDPVIDVIDDIVTEENTEEIVAATNLSANNHSMEAGNGIEIVEDDKGFDRSEIAEDGNSSDVNVVATFPFTEVDIDFSADSKDRNSEVTVVFSEDSKDQNSEAGNGVRRKTVEHGSQSDMIEVMPVSPQLEAEPILDEEADNEFMEESAVADRNESLMMFNNSQKSLLEPRTDNDHSVKNSDIEEASDCEVTQLKSVESVANRIKADFVLSSGAALLPHPSKVLTGGEDAYFINGQTWLGVADGVSQWSLEGVNPGVYAQEGKNSSKDCPGSSTVLIAHFDGEALQVANIGDSGFIILRHSSVYKKSSPMLHEFHFPVQIERGDDPSYLTEEYRVDSEQGELLASLNSDKRLEEIAELLATQAQEVGRSGSARCPFADAAQAAGYVGYAGGKLHDVAVIVSVVRRQ
ncbi:unnamed protein product [Fraxinus pennsylvanica]|uniref:Protein phosphatase n=1 Tax=Fraxinus pennsylvanica TaxID=56036 RepID=A0AAD2DVA5_9LAMI|nr:unnamed protein product [Fraxinus pennsylvanica]